MAPLYYFAIFLLGLNVSINSYAEPVNSVEEPKLRAAIVLAILRYTHWPADAELTGSFNLCTSGHPQSEQVLLQVSGLHKYQELPINIAAHYGKPHNFSTCHALILGPDSDSKTAFEKLTKQENHGLLTICDGCQGNDMKPMVTLSRRQKRIAFEVNLTKSQAAGINFSSALLELALTVRGGQ